MTDREARAEDGREAFATMMQGIREMGAALHALAASNTALARTNTALALQVDRLVQQGNARLAKDSELVLVTRSSIAHSAALQSQMGELVHVIGRMTGVEIKPGAPPELAPFDAWGAPPEAHGARDPLAHLGQAVVNGVRGALNGGRGTRRPPGA